MTGVQPELWAQRPGEAIEFYRAAFDAEVLFSMGEADDMVAQLSVGKAMFWVATAAPDLGRFSPGAIGGGTGRTLLVVDDPDAVVTRALAAGATLKSAVADEHVWRIGRIVDPAGHEWEIGTPLGPWPPG